MRNMDVELNNKNIYAKSIIVPVLLFCFSLIFQAIAVEPLIGIYDEGLVLVGAELVNKGLLPYRDFWTMYGPGQFYITSWLYTLFGYTNLVVRAMGIVEKSFIVFISYMLIARFASKACAVAAAVVILLLLTFAHVEAFPAFPALALGLAAIYFAEKGMRGSRLCLFAAGIFTGFEATFRHDLGFYSAIGICACLLFRSYCQWPRLKTSEVLRVAMRQCVLYAAGISLVFVPVIAYLFYSVPLVDLYENLIYIPSKIYPAVRAIPFPGRDAIPTPGIAAFVVYAPFMVVGCILLFELIGARKKGKSHDNVEPDNGWMLISLVLTTCLLFTIKGMVRVSYFHMIQAVVLSVILMAIYIPRALQKTRAARFVLLPGLAIPFALLISPAFAGLTDFSNGMKELMSGHSEVSDRCRSPVLPRMRCANLDNDYFLAAQKVRAATQVDDKIYVGTTRHDKLFVNAVTFYFVAERLPATKWYDLHPGVQTQERVQLQMIQQMRDSPPKMVVLDSRWDDVKEPNDSQLSNGSKLLDEYLNANFEEIRRFGTVRVLAPR